MQIHIDPDFCGWPDPNWIGKRWRLTNEQWYLFTRLLMREMARAKYEDKMDYPYGTIWDKLNSTWEWRAYAATIIVSVFRADPCHSIADVPWGVRLDWRQYACFAAGIVAELKKNPLLLPALKYLLPTLLAQHADEHPTACVDIDKLFRNISANICDLNVYNDPTFVSGLFLINTPMTFDGDYDPGHMKLIDSYVDKAFFDAGGKDEDKPPTGYPDENQHLVTATTPIPPKPGYKPTAGDFTGYALPGNRQWAPTPGSTSTATKPGIPWIPIVAIGVMTVLGAAVVLALKAPSYE